MDGHSDAMLVNVSHEDGKEQSPTGTNHNHATALHKQSDDTLLNYVNSNVNDSQSQHPTSLSSVNQLREVAHSHSGTVQAQYNKQSSEDLSTWPAVTYSTASSDAIEQRQQESLYTPLVSSEPPSVAVSHSTCYNTARNKITDYTIKQCATEPVATINCSEESKQRRFKQQKSGHKNWQLRAIDKSLDFGDGHLHVPAYYSSNPSKPRYYQRLSQSPVNRAQSQDWKNQASISSAPNNGSQTNSTSSSIYLQEQQHSRSLSNLHISKLQSPSHYSRDLSSIGVAYMRANGSTFGNFRALLSNPNKSYPDKSNASITESIVVDPRTHLIDVEKGSAGAPPNYSSTGAHTHLSEDAYSSSSAINMTTNTTTNNNLGGVTVINKGHLQASKSHDSSNASGHLPPNVRATKAPTNTRLARRQTLYAARKLLADWALFFAMLGILMMIVENELTAADVYGKTSDWSYGVKLVIVGSTVVLLILIAQYHYVEVMLFMNDNSAEDWRIAMSVKRTLQIVVEIVVCAICPIPGDFYFVWTTVHADGLTKTSTEVPIDVVLSIPMFFRLYLICRVMLLHSRLFTDASSRSIGALNRVNFNARFVLKTLMTLCPGTVLLVVVATFWIIASWILRLCERYHTGDPVNIDALKHQNYLNSLWMITITFLSVGYGDMVPNTYCGRAVAVISGIMGVSTSSLVVAVIARKLELTRAEKHVHNFMMDTQLTKRLKHAAANVLRETWLIYKYRRLMEKFEVGKIRQHQRKFLLAIYELRKVKRDQRKLAENSMTIGDIAKSSQGTFELMNDMGEWQENVSERLTTIDTQMQSVQTDMRRITNLLEQCVGISPASINISSQPPSSANLEVRQRKGKLEKRSVTGSSERDND